MFEMNAHIFELNTQKKVLRVTVTQYFLVVSLMYRNRKFYHFIDSLRNSEMGSGCE